MSRRTPRAKSGFTLVEVMIAIGVMTVGSLGILAMHQAVSGANRTANEMNTAIAITEKWMERVDRDSLKWTSADAITTTDYLKELGISAAPTNWFKPTPSDTSESYAFDHSGEDDTSGNNTKYCVNLRLSWLRQGRSARVDIRTFWYRDGYVHGTPSHSKWVQGSAFRSADCDASAADNWDLGEAPNVNVIFASTVVRWLGEGT